MSKKSYSTSQDKRKHTMDEIENIIKDERIKDLFNKLMEKNNLDKYSDKKSKKHDRKHYSEEDNEKEEYSEKKSKKSRKHRKHRKEKEFTTFYSDKGKKRKYSNRHSSSDEKEEYSEHESIKIDEVIEEHYEREVDYTEDISENLENSIDNKHRDNCYEYSDEDDYNHCNHCNDKDDCSDDDIIVECCEAEVDSETLSLCPNTEMPVCAAERKVVIKTPVVLAEPRINISLISCLELEEPALEIKRIRKNVYLTQCKLIPNSGGEDPCYGVVFIEGFIRKNIEYATAECRDEDSVNGKIKHTTVKVPFRCTTRVKFTTKPIFTNNVPQNEVEIVQNSLNICDPCGESIIGKNPCEQTSRFVEFFNEKVFCELVDTEIVESDILHKPASTCCTSPVEQTFKNITEKVILNITVKLLQNQQVLIQ